MAFPTVSDADTQSGTQTTNSASWTLTYPTNIAAGDLLLAFVGADGGGTAFQAGSEAGWLSTNSGIGGAVALTIGKKLADGSETGTFTCTLFASEQGAWRTMRIPASTWEGSIGTDFANSASSGSVVMGATFATGASTTPNPPSLDPNNWAAEDTLWFAVMSCDTSRTVSIFPQTPSPFTNTGSSVSGGSTGATLAWGRLESNATSVDPGTFTISASDDWAAQTVAIRPAAPAVPRVPKNTPYPQLLAH